jgi:hypothetical protein
MRWLGRDYCLILDHFEKNYYETRTYAPLLCIRPHTPKKPFSWSL